MNAKEKYAQYLKSDHWREYKALKARTIASNRCNLCCCYGQIHCHHYHYKTLGREALGDTIFLCSDCHQFAHDFSLCRREILRLGRWWFKHYYRKNLWHKLKAPSEIFKQEAMRFFRSKVAKGKKLERYGSPN